MTQDGEPAADFPVHARVLPSLVVEQLRRPFKTWLGIIEPLDLVRWTRPSLPPATVAEEIRVATFRRLRSRAELWQRPAGVPLPDKWESQFPSSVVGRVGAVLKKYSGVQFETLSIDQVKFASRLSFEETLSILATLEAVEWVAPTAAWYMRSEWRTFGGETGTTCSQGLKASVEQALALPWIEGVKAGDLRLAAPGGEAPAAWMRHQLDVAVEGGRVSCHLEAVVHDVLQADKMSYAEEVAALAGATLKRCRPAPGPTQKERWVAIFVMRFISPGAPNNMQDVGRAFGLTRERVRQICDAMLAPLQGEQASTPALDRVMRMACRIVPCTLDEADEQLARHLGDNCGTRGVLELLDVLGRPAPVRIGKVNLRVAGRYEDAPILEAVDDESRWPQAALRYAAAECAIVGCTSLLRMSGALAMRDGVASGRQSLESLFATAPGFRWLDQEDGWFTIGDTLSCGAAARLRKILSVARRPVSVDEVAEAFMSDTRWFSATDGRALAIPPTNVIQAMVAGWPWVKTQQYNRFSPVSAIPTEEALSDIEQKLVEVIEGSGGVSTSWQIHAATIAAIAVSKFGVTMALGSSPILIRLEHGIYALRGRTFSAESLIKARSNLFPRDARFGVDEEGVFNVLVTAASLRNEQYTVPMRLRGELAGKDWPINEMACRARVTQTGTLRGLNQCFPGLKPGDSIEVRIDEGSLSVRRLPPQSMEEQAAP